MALVASTKDDNRLCVRGDSPLDSTLLVDKILLIKGLDVRFMPVGSSPFGLERGELIDREGGDPSGTTSVDEEITVTIDVKVLVVTRSVAGSDVVASGTSTRI